MAERETKKRICGRVRWVRREIYGGTYGTVAGFERVQLRLCSGVPFGWCDGHYSCLDHLPELVVLILEQYDGTVALAVEGRRGVVDGLADDVLDLVVLDRGFLLEVVVGAAGRNSKEVGGRHVG